MTARQPSLPRVAALVGPFAGGKTSLLESLLFVTGAIPRKGSVKAGSCVGDSTPEARERQFTTEATIAQTSFLGETWTFIDCPGSVEFQQECHDALMIADAALVVCEPDPARAIMVAPLLRALDAQRIPHLLFINKIGPETDLTATLAALQAVSDRPLVLRELPLREKDAITGYVDLVSERAYRYRDGAPSDPIALPEAVLAAEKAARQEMLERLADFDDGLLEDLLTETEPPTGAVYETLSRDLAQDLIVPVLFGAAEADRGVRRLLKALRHEVPGPERTVARLGLSPNGPAYAAVFKTVHAAHTGKLSYARVLRGEIADGQVFGGQRIAGLSILPGGAPRKVAAAGLGEVVVLGRMDGLHTGEAPGAGCERPWPPALPPLFGLALSADRKQDEVKLTAALAKLIEEDRSLSLVHAETGEIVLWGQGALHLQVAADKLRGRFGLSIATRAPRVPYRETIRRPVSQHARHKRQSGGHGQFADVQLEIAPLPRGMGHQFHDRIVGGMVPKHYIPAVGEGVAESLKRGPLGFPVVDVAVTLTGGGFHAVDSSDMAFKIAGRMAMSEAMPKAEPVLLEPVLAVEIAVPDAFTAKAQRAISGRRGQILGYDAIPGQPGWDVVAAFLPQAEMSDLIVELRSLTMGVGTFSWRHDHLQDLAGQQADKVVKGLRAAGAC